MSHSDSDSDVQSLNSPKALLYLKTECTLLWYILRPEGCSWAFSQIQIIVTLENCMDPSIVCSNLFLYSSDYLRQILSEKPLKNFRNMRFYFI